MGAPLQQAGRRREAREVAQRAVDAHLCFHQAYGGDPARLAGGRRDLRPLAAWAAEQGVERERLEADVVRLFVPRSERKDGENGGSPPPYR